MNSQMKLLHREDRAWWHFSSSPIHLISIHSVISNFLFSRQGNYSPELLNDNWTYRISNSEIKVWCLCRAFLLLFAVFWDFFVWFGFWCFCLLFWGVCGCGWFLWGGCFFVWVCVCWGVGDGTVIVKFLANRFLLVFYTGSGLDTTKSQKEQWGFFMPFCL